MEKKAFSTREVKGSRGKRGSLGGKNGKFFSDFTAPRSLLTHVGVQHALHALAHVRHLHQVVSLEPLHLVPEVGNLGVRRVRVCSAGEQVVVLTFLLAPPPPSITHTGTLHKHSQPAPPPCLGVVGVRHQLRPGHVALRGVGVQVDI